MNLPHFICIGAQKAGTTWIEAQLRQHPSIWMPPMKEVHYFDYVHRQDFRKWITVHVNKALKRELLDAVKAANEAAVDWKRIRYLSELATFPKKFSDGWYKKLFSFAPKDAICGEITPEYCSIGEVGIQHMKRLAPDVKLIYVIRDPVKRAWSQLKMNMVRSGKVDKVSLLDEKKILQFLKNPNVMDRGDYARFVPEWDKHFIEGKNILYIPFREIETNPGKLMTELEAYLELPTYHDYKGLKEVVHKGSDSKMPVSIGEKLRGMMANQYEYIPKRFGSEFYSKI